MHYFHIADAKAIERPRTLHNSEGFDAFLLVERANPARQN